MKIYVMGARGFPNVQGGIEKHAEEIYPILAQKYNYNILILTTEKPMYKEWNNITFKKIKTFKSNSLEKIVYSLNATFYCIFKRPDIVHIQGLNSALSIPILKLFGLKVIYTQHSMDYLYPKWGWFAKKILLILEYFSTFADKITVVSPLLRDRFKDRYNIDTYITYNGVRFDNDSLDKNNYFINENFKEKRYILFVGRITPEKDLLTLIHAFNLIDDNDLYLVIVGDIEYNDKYNKNVVDLSSKNNQIILTGKIDNKYLPLFYKNALLFVLPSKYEAFPIVVLEAIYNHTDILLSDIPALKQYGFENKYYFEVSNVVSLNKQIIFLLTNPTTIIKKDNLKKQILSLYDWDDSASIFSKIYEELYSC